MTDSIAAVDLLKIIIPVAAGTAGVAARAVQYAVKKELNGSAQRIKDIAEVVQTLQVGQERMSNRMTRLETIVDERTDRRAHPHMEMQDK